MDKTTKIGIAAIILIILALLIFWPTTPEAKDAYLVCNAHNETSKGNDGYLEFICYENSTDPSKTDVKLENVTILVNVTYENHTTVKYNLTTDSSGKAEIHDLGKGKYSVSANMVGDNIKNTTTFTKKVKVHEYKAPSKTTTDKKTEKKTETKTEQETEYDTEYKTEYDTEYETTYDTEYDTEYETYYEPSESYTVEYYWVYV
jgi:hypothetical protein